MQSVALTIPYLKARSIGGGLMTLGHLVFAVHFFMMGWKFGPRRLGAALLAPPLVAPPTGGHAVAQVAGRAA
jgi:cytochrome c oxidase cbb3-type subunit 1